MISSQDNQNVLLNSKQENTSVSKQTQYAPEMYPQFQKSKSSGSISFPNTTTLVYLHDKTEQKLLFGVKKTGFGKGNLNGFGGKVELEETVRQGAVRELFEESSCKTTEKDLQFCGINEFFYIHDPKSNNRCSVFLCESWEGEPLESREMTPKWVDHKILTDKQNKIYNSMWEDDVLWIPEMLDSKPFYYRFIFSKKGMEQVIPLNIDTLKETGIPPKNHLTARYAEAKQNDGEANTKSNL